MCGKQTHGVSSAEGAVNCRKTLHHSWEREGGLDEWRQIGEWKKAAHPRPRWEGPRWGQVPMASRIGSTGWVNNFGIKDDGKGRSRCRGSNQRARGRKQRCHGAETRHGSKPPGCRVGCSEARRTVPRFWPAGGRRMPAKDQIRQEGVPVVRGGTA